MSDISFITSENDFKEESTMKTVCIINGSNSSRRTLHLFIVASIFLLITILATTIICFSIFQFMYPNMLVVFLKPNSHSIQSSNNGITRKYKLSEACYNLANGTEVEGLKIPEDSHKWLVIFDKMRSELLIIYT